MFKKAFEIEKEYFSTININDLFFDSLKNDYPGFVKWFNKKCNEHEDAYVQYDENGNIIGFLYLKIENDIVDDVRPNIKANKILKVGTFKINSHGTRLGERFIKLILDYAICENVDLCYVTAFKKHTGLIKILKQFGFYEYGFKGSVSNSEFVLVKNMRRLSNNVNLDYPLINTINVRKYLLSIYPLYHSAMFTDSILKTEDRSIIKDISYGNSIHKVYVCRMEVDSLKEGDILVLYRTADYGKIAEYSSVATSVCVVEEVKKQEDFNSFDDFYNYASQYSIFNKDDLLSWYNRGKCRTIKFTYNVALKKRITRHDLIEKVGLSRNNYWGFLEIDDAQFDEIINLGNISDNLFI